MIDAIRVRLSVWYALGLGLFMIAFAAASYGLLARSTARRTDASLEETARAFATAWSAQRTQVPRSVPMPTAVARRFGAGDLEILVLDRARVVAASSPRRPWVERRADMMPRPDLAAMMGEIASAGGTFTTLRGAPGPPRRVYAMPLRLGDRRQVVAVSHALGDQEAMLRTARTIWLVAIPVVLALALAGGYLLAGRALAPVGQMAAQAQRIGAATLHERLQVRNERDELGQLARVFNGLLDRLARAFEQQRQFVADASHELRTPVAVVRGEAEVALSREQRAPSEYREALQIIEDEARRMSRLVDDMFLLARTDAGQQPLAVVELYLNDLVVESVRALRTLAAARGITLDYSAGAEMPFRGDDGLLRRLIVNLIENAIKYGDAGRPVTIRAHVGHEYVIIVRNEGPPIPPEIRDRVFDRFVRGAAGSGAASRVPSADEAGGGAGLGLAIGRWIAEAHGGRLELLRSDADGTAFRIALPAPAGITSS